MQRLIGKTKENWTVDDLIEVVRDYRIRLVSLMHIGGDGWLKALDFVPGDYSHLHDIITTGERADGSSLFAGMDIPINASDVVLRPRIPSAFLDPFSEMPTLVLLCGHYGRDGAPLPESPDTIVRAAYQRVKEQSGVDLHALGEVEYFLGKKPEQTSAYGSDECGYHATSPFVFGEGMRRKALTILAEIGVPVKYGHSEVGYIEASSKDDMVWEQHEVELGLLPLPEAAEAVVLTMWVLRNLSQLYGIRCSFDPIVRKGHAGSGMHFHFSPLLNGKHSGGFDKNGKLEPPAQWLIGGLSMVGGALMAFGNRDQGSFIRLTQGKEAPNTVTWGQYNRKALIRLPLIAMNSAGCAVSPPTIEFRLPDGAAHPHLLLAGVAQAMLLGKETANLEQLLLKTSAENAVKNPNAVTPVPKNFGEVAAALIEHRHVFEAGGVFPIHAYESLIRQLVGKDVGHS